MMPTTPIKTHSRRVSEQGTEYGTPQSNIDPSDQLDVPGSPTRLSGHVEDMDDFEQSRGGSNGHLFSYQSQKYASGSRSKGSTGRGSLSSNEGEGDELLDEVDDFLRQQGSSSSSATRGYDVDPSSSRTDSASTSGRFDVYAQPGPSSSKTDSGRTTPDPVLELLDNDDDDLEEEMEMFDQDEEDEEYGTDAGEPLVGRRGRRKRRRWDENENKKESSLWELVPPLILAHPLPLFPLLSLLPYNFLPAGVVFFIPVISVLTVLSACAHIVVVYLSWYLKVPTFEEIAATVAGRYGTYGRWAGRAAVVIAVVGMVVSWLGTLHPLLQPILEAYIPDSKFWSSRILWTILTSCTLLPSLLPSRMSRSLRRAPIFLALLLPVVAFLIIGRTVEITKAAAEAPSPETGDDGEDSGTEIIARAVGDAVSSRLGLAGTGSAGAGITTLTIFLSPHLNTLSTHSTLARNKRSSFPIPALATSLSILVLSLPLALVPYYLLPNPTDTTLLVTPNSPSGVFARLPPSDAGINVARVLQCIISLGTCNLWILRGRDTILRSMGVDRGERLRVGRYTGLGLWVIVVGLACLGGWLAEKIELLGVMATLAVAWLLPSVFFIITFHVRSPLAIVFPGKAPPPSSTANQESSPPDPANPAAGSRTRSTHSRGDSMSDPSLDAVLARKERQLQKRRLGRRLWQDLIVYVGILPVGCLTIFWTLGRFVGLW